MNEHIELYDLAIDEGETNNIAGMNIESTRKIEEIPAGARAESMAC